MSDSFDSHNIDWVTRVGLQIKPATAIDGRRFRRPVIVRFLCRSKGDEIIRAVKTRRNMSARLDMPGESRN